VHGRTPGRARESAGSARVAGQGEPGNKAPDVAFIKSHAEQYKQRWTVQTRRVEAEAPGSPSCGAICFDRWSLSSQHAALQARAGRPIAGNATEAGRAQNRHVVLIAASL